MDKTLYTLKTTADSQFKIESFQRDTVVVEAIRLINDAGGMDDTNLAIGELLDGGDTIDYDGDTITITERQLATHTYYVEETDSDTARSTVYYAGASANEAKNALNERFDDLYNDTDLLEGLNEDDLTEITDHLYTYSEYRVGSLYAKAHFII